VSAFPGQCRRAVLILIAALGFAGSSHAHTLSESHSSWQISGSTIRVEMIVPDLEAKRLSPDGRELPSSAELGRYLAAHLGARSGDKPCSLQSAPRALSASTGALRQELVFKCPAASDLRIHSSAFYERVPSHTNFARIQDNDGRFFEQLLTDEHRDVEISGGDAGSEIQNARFVKFIQMGIMHIFTGIDHMSFMLGLVLISRRVRDLLFVVSGFTLGHSLTLALAVTGWLRPDRHYIDALVALTIALIGAENLGDSTHRPLPFALGLGGILITMAAAKALGLDVTLPTLLLVGGGMFAASYLMLTGHLQDAGRVRLLVTLVFGLIHGFGFASDLLDMQLPAGRLAQLLVGFNLGVEIGQVTVVLGALLVAATLVKLRLVVPRPLFTDLAASFLVGEGLYWFLGRTVMLG
jgi:hypothetical protein